jgi:hypothetical protein
MIISFSESLLRSPQSRAYQNSTDPQPVWAEDNDRDNDSPNIQGKRFTKIPFGCILT